MPATPCSCGPAFASGPNPERCDNCGGKLPATPTQIADFRATRITSVAELERQNAALLAALKEVHAECDAAGLATWPGDTMAGIVTALENARAAIAAAEGRTP